MNKNICVATDFSLGTISKYYALNNSYENKVSEVFGNLNPSVFTSGRSELYLPKCNIEELAIYINQLHKFNMEFNYTLNGFNMNNIELDAIGYKKLIRFVGQLLDIGVDRFSIASPILMDILSYHFKDIKMIASAICQINSLSMAKKYANIRGVDRLVIYEDSTRDFKLMRSIRDEVGIDMEVIVNQSCQFGCIYRNFHRIGLSNERAENNNTIKVDDYFQLCWENKLRDPSEMLKIPTIIRPEDLKHYGNVGVSYFKIVDRMINSNNPQVIESYMKEGYKGNIFELLPGKLDLIALDNDELDGFLDYYINGSNPCHSGCVQCGYCNKYAEKIKKDSYALESRINRIQTEVKDYIEHGPTISREAWSEILS